MGEPEAVRRTDGPHAVRPRSGRRETLGDGGGHIRACRETMKALPGDLSTQRGRGVSTGSRLMPLNAERLVERIVQPRQQ